MLENPNFSLLDADAGAKGRIVEDCFSILFREGSVKLPFTKLPDGGNTNPPRLMLTRNTMTVLEVEGGDGAVPLTANWCLSIDTLVFVPRNRYYKGVDFVIAREIGARLHIYYVKCTGQYIQVHGFCEADHYKAWKEMLDASSATTATRVFLVFLTPHSTNLRIPGQLARFFLRKTVFHVQYAAVESGHQLLAKLKHHYPSSTTA